MKTEIHLAAVILLEHPDDQPLPSTSDLGYHMDNVARSLSWGPTGPKPETTFRVQRFQAAFIPATSELPPAVTHA